MHFSGLPGILGGVASAMITSWFFGRIKTAVPPTGNDLRTLRYHVGYAVLGWVGFLFFAACIVGVCFSKELPRVLWFCLVVFGFFALLSAVLIVSYHRYRLVYGVESIRYFPLWGRPFTFAWSDVEAVRFSSVAQWWRLRLHDGRNVRVGTYMHGAVEFIQMLAAHTRLDLPPARLPNGQVFTVRSADHS